jgi:hypothetical protein
MSTSFPTSKQLIPNPISTDLLENADNTLDHDYQHGTINDTIEALQDKVGIDGSATTTTHDYKLSAVTGSAKALTSGTSTQSVTGLNLVTPTLSLTSDATGDMYYRNSGGALTRLPIGPSGQIIQAGASGVPEYVANPAAADASTTVKGVVEEATQAEVDAGTTTGGTSARLFQNPSTIRAKKYNDKVTGTSGSDAYAIAPSPAITAYADGQIFSFEADVANTGAATLNVNSIGAKTIKKNKSSDLETGDIVAGQYVLVQYDSGDDTFQLLSPTSQTSSRTFAQQINVAGASTTTGINVQYSCVYTGFSTTEPIIVASGSGSSDGGAISRFIKQPNGALIQTHTQSASNSTTNNSIGVCVIGDYVYVSSNNGGTGAVTRYDKADLANPQIMTLSGATITPGTPLFTDGTDLYQVTGAGTARRWTISGTTLTSAATPSYTSISASDATWCDGTSVYQMTGGTLSNITCYKWALAGGARTTGTTHEGSQYYPAGGSVMASGGGGIIKESGVTGILYTAQNNNLADFRIGKIIPLADF